MYMLDRFVAHVVAPYLEKYVRNLQREHVTVSILHGNVVLHDLELRRDALRQLKLPICIKHGTIRKLTVFIPWARMRSESLRVVIDGIDIVVHPKRAEQYSEEEKQQEEHEEKMEELAVFEELWRAHNRSNNGDDQAIPDVNEADDEKQADASFLARWRTAMLNNILIDVTDVSIRYEDYVNNPDRPVDARVSFDKLTLTTTDGNWQPMFAKASDQLLYKLAKLHGVRMFIGHAQLPATDLNGADDPSEVCLPFDVVVRAQHQPFSADADVPRWQVSAEVSDTKIRIDRMQWDAVWQSIRFVKKHDEIQQFLQFRPTVPLRSNPSAWWHYAYNSVVFALRKNSRKVRFNWQLFWERKKKEVEYMELHRRRQGALWLTPLTPDEEARATQLELELPVEHLLKARMLAYKRLELEATNPAAQRAAEKARLAAQRAGGWRSWWAWSTGRGAAAASPSADEGQDEQMWDLIDADVWTAEQRTIVESMFDMGHQTDDPLAEAVNKSVKVKQNKAVVVHATIASLHVLLLDYERKTFGAAVLNRLEGSYRSTEETWSYDLYITSYSLRGDTVGAASTSTATTAVGGWESPEHFTEVVGVAPSLDGLNVGKPNIAAKYAKHDPEEAGGVFYSCSIEIQPISVEVNVPWLQRVVDFWGVDTSLTPVNVKTGQTRKTISIDPNEALSDADRNNIFGTALIMWHDSHHPTEILCLVMGLTVRVPDVQRTALLSMPMLTITNDVEEEVRKRRKFFGKQSNDIHYVEDDWRRIFLISISGLRVDAAWTEPDTTFKGLTGDRSRRYVVPVLLPFDLGLMYGVSLVKEKFDQPLKSIEVATGQDLVISTDLRALSVILSAATLLTDFANDASGRSAYAAAAQGQGLVTSDESTSVDVVGPFSSWYLGPTTPAAIVPDERNQWTNITSLQLIERRCVAFRYQTVTVFHRDRPTMPATRYTVLPGRFFTTKITHDGVVDVTLYCCQGGASHDVLAGEKQEAQQLCKDNGIEPVESVPQLKLLVEAKCQLLAEASSIASLDTEDRINKLWWAFGVLERAAHCIPCRCAIFRVATEQDADRIIQAIHRAANEPIPKVETPVVDVYQMKQKILDVKIVLSGVQINILDEPADSRVSHLSASAAAKSLFNLQLRGDVVIRHSITVFDSVTNVTAAGVLWGCGAQPRLLICDPSSAVASGRRATTVGHDPRRTSRSPTNLSTSNVSSSPPMLGKGGRNRAFSMNGDSSCGDVSIISHTSGSATGGATNAAFGLTFASGVGSTPVLSLRCDAQVEVVMCTALAASCETMMDVINIFRMKRFNVVDVPSLPYGTVVQFVDLQEYFAIEFTAASVLLVAHYDTAIVAERKATLSAMDDAAKRERLNEMILYPVMELHTDAFNVRWGISESANNTVIKGWQPTLLLFPGTTHTATFMCPDIDSIEPNTMEFGFKVTYPPVGMSKHEWQVSKSTTGFHFSHFLHMVIEGGIAQYRNTHLWTIIEYFTNGVMTRLAYMATRENVLAGVQLPSTWPPANFPPPPTFYHTLIHQSICIKNAKLRVSVAEGGPIIFSGRCKRLSIYSDIIPQSEQKDMRLGLRMDFEGLSLFSHRSQTSNDLLSEVVSKTLPLVSYMDLSFNVWHNYAPFFEDEATQTLQVIFQKLQWESTTAQFADLWQWQCGCFMEPWINVHPIKTWPANPYNGLMAQLREKHALELKKALAHHGHNVDDDDDDEENQSIDPVLREALRYRRQPVTFYAYDIRANRFVIHLFDDDIDEAHQALLHATGYEPKKASPSCWLCGTQLGIELKWRTDGAFESVYAVQTLAAVDPIVIKPTPSALFDDDDDPSHATPLPSRSRAYSSIRGATQEAKDKARGRFLHIMAPLKIKYGWNGDPKERVVFGDYSIGGVELVLSPESLLSMRDTFLSLKVRNAAAPMFKWQQYTPGQPATPWDPKTQQDYAVCHKVRAQLVCLIVVGSESDEYGPSTAFAKRLTSLGEPLAMINLCGISVDHQSMPFADSVMTGVSLETLNGSIIAPTSFTTESSSSRARTRSVLEMEATANSLPLIVPRHESGDIVRLMKSSDEGFSGEVNSFWLIVPVASKISQLRAATQSTSFELLGHLGSFREDRILTAQTASATALQRGREHSPARPVDRADDGALDGTGGAATSLSKLASLRKDIPLADEIPPVTLLDVSITHPCLIITEHESMTRGAVVDMGVVRIAATAHKQFSNITATETKTALKCEFVGLNVTSLHDHQHRLLKPVNIEAFMATSPRETTGDLHIGPVIFDLAQEYYESLLRSAARHLVPDDEALVNRQNNKSGSNFERRNSVIAPSASGALHNKALLKRRANVLLEGDEADIQAELGDGKAAARVASGVATVKQKRAETKVSLKCVVESILLRVHSDTVCVELGVLSVAADYNALGLESQLNALLTLVRCGVEGKGELLQLGGSNSPLSATVDWDTGNRHTVTKANLGVCVVYLHEHVLAPAIAFLYEPYRRIVLPSYGVSEITVLTDDTVLQEDLVLSSRKQLRVSNVEFNHVVLNLSGYDLHLLPAPTAVLVVDPGVTLALFNCRLHLYERSLDQCVSTGNGGCVVVDDSVEIVRVLTDTNGLVLSEDETEESTQLALEFAVEITLPDSTGLRALSLRAHSQLRQATSLRNSNKSTGLTFELDNLEAMCFYYSELTGEVVDFSSLIKPWSVELRMDSNTEPRVITNIGITAAEGVDVRLRVGDAALVIESLRQAESAFGHIKDNVPTSAVDADALAVDDRLLLDSDDSRPVATTTVAISLKQIGFYFVDDSGTSVDQPLLYVSVFSVTAPTLEMTPISLSVHLQLQFKIECYDLEQGGWRPLVETVELDVLFKQVKTITLHDLATRRGQNKVGLRIRPLHLRVTPVTAQIFKRASELLQELSEKAKAKPSTTSQQHHAAVGPAAAVATTPAMRAASNLPLHTAALQRVPAAAARQPAPPESPVARVQSMRPTNAVTEEAPLMLPPTASTQSKAQFSQYIITQFLGFPVTIRFAESSSTRFPDPFVLESGDSAAFNFPRTDGKELSITQHQVVVEHGTGLVPIFVGRAGVSLAQFHYPRTADTSNNDAPFKFVVDVSLKQGQKVIVLRSNVTFNNTLPFAVELVDVGLLPPDGGSLSIPASKMRTRCSLRPIAGISCADVCFGLQYYGLASLYDQAFLCSAAVSDRTGADAAGHLAPSFTGHAAADDSASRSLQDAVYFTARFAKELKPLSMEDNVTDVKCLLEAPFNIVNYSGANIQIALYQLRSGSKRATAVRVMLPGNTSGLSYHHVVTLAIDEGATVPITHVNPQQDVFMDVIVNQPTGESLTRTAGDPALIRSHYKKTRATHLIVKDQFGQPLLLRLTYEYRKVIVSCGYWLVNHTMHYLQVAEPRLIQGTKRCAGQTTEGIAPTSSLPFLMCTPSQHEASKKSKAEIVVRVGRHTIAGTIEWSDWSDPLHIDRVGSTHALCKAPGEDDSSISVAFTVAYVGGILKNTMTLTFAPRWIVMNRCGRDLTLRHNDSKEVMHLTEGQSRTIDTCQRRGPNVLKLQYSETAEVTQCEACDPICIDDLAETGINMRYALRINQRKIQFAVIRVSVYTRSGIHFVAVDAVNKPPHVIENRTKCTAYVKQVGSNRELIVYPRTSKGFVWDNEQLPHKLSLYITDNDSGITARTSLNLDPAVLTVPDRKVHQEVMVGNVKLYIRVRSSGGTFAISVTRDTTIDAVLTQPFHNRALRVQIERVFVMIGLHSDIALLSVMGIDATFSQGRSQETGSDMQLVDIRVGHIQIDDERSNTRQRHVLYTAPGEQQSFVMLRQMDRSNPIVHLRRLEITLRPTWVHLEDTFLFDVLTLVDRITAYTSSANAATKSQQETSIATFSRDHWCHEVNRPTDENSVIWRMSLIDSLQIEHILLSVSLYRGSDKKRDPLRQRIGILSSFIGSVNDARFDWRRVSEKGLANKIWILAEYLKQEYMGQLQKQVLNLVHVAGLDSMRTIVNDLLDGYMGPRIAQSEKVIGQLEPMIKYTRFTESRATEETWEELSRDHFDDAQIVSFSTVSGGIVTCALKRGEDINSSRLISTNHGAIATGSASLFGHQCRCREIEHEKRRGRLSQMTVRVEELAHHTSWEEFTAMLPAPELRRFGTLALQQLVRTRSFTMDNNVPIMCTRCAEVELLRQQRVESGANCPLPHPDTQLISWSEYCHHASWHEFAYLTSDAELIRYCNQMKSGFVGTPQGVRRIDDESKWILDEDEDTPVPDGDQAEAVKLVKGARLTT